MLVPMTDDPTEPAPASETAPSSGEPTADQPPTPLSERPQEVPPYPAPPAPAAASVVAPASAPFPGPAAPPAPPAPQHAVTTETPAAGGPHTDTAEQPAVSAIAQTSQTDQFAAAGRGAPPLPPAASPAGPARTGSSTPPSPPRRGRRAVAVLAAAGLMAASGAGGALLALGLDDDDAPAASNSLNAAPVSGDSDSAPDEPLSQAADTVLPSVVSITFESDQGTGQGSGVIISTDGQILTNNHVVAEAEDGGLSVTFADGSRADAEVLGRDPATDLAVIQAQDVGGLAAATLGSSADLHVGDTVLAIGSPLGLDGSVSAGIVSALNRSITLQETPLDSPFGDQGDEPGGATDAVIDAIQTDAAINPGNSGGALINTDGEVIGINTAIASLAGGTGTGSQSGNIGVGFAIPIDDARAIADQLIEDGEATHAYLGVRIGNAEEGTGAVVGGVEEGQPAADAGLEEGDVITKVDDKDIADATALTSAIRSHQPGDQVTITYTRDGDEHTTEVTLGELPTG